MSTTHPSTKAGAEARALDLAGAWHYALDPEDRGLTERWERRAWSDTLELPGDLAGQGIGDPVTLETRWVGSVFDDAFYHAERFAPYREQERLSYPFWLQPRLRYQGVAWYRKRVTLPGDWEGRWLRLHLERPHWQTQLWVDGVAKGSRDSLSTPHLYDLGRARGGATLELVLRIDNRVIVAIGQNAHSISDHTQGSWHGCVGALRLEARPAVCAEHMQVYPDARQRSLRVQGVLQHAGDAAVAVRVIPRLSALDGIAPLRVEETAFAYTCAPGANAFTLELAFDGEPELWSEVHPALYALGLTIEPLDAPRGGASTWETRFGFRRVEAQGRQLTLNGHRLFLRGTLDCAIFPRTAYPPTDLAEWKRIFGAIQAHGFNHVRFHSWCPPEAAFCAADEQGLYLQVEAASWPGHGVTLGDGQPVDAWIEAESKRILDTYGNHPSFLFMAMGNEPEGPRHKDWLTGWVARRIAEDNRRLYACSAGWPLIEANQYHISDQPRIQHWEEGLASRINAAPPETCSDYVATIQAHDVPVVCHENGQWCVYPGFGEVQKYTGVLKPRNFGIFRDWLEANGMGHLAERFQWASGMLQLLCYKEEIESALRTPQMAGFQLLGLQDFPGQGTALVGVLDAFWEAKPYVSAERFRRFCGPLVPLARLPRRVFTAEAAVDVTCLLAHYGPVTTAVEALRWQLLDASGATLRDGHVHRSTNACEGVLDYGTLRLNCAGLPAPGQYRLELSIEGTSCANDWDLWVYPEQVDAGPCSDLLVTEVDADVLQRLDAGEHLLLQLPRDRVAGDADGPVQLGFSTTFWNTSWTQGQAPHTMGILCDPKHPALAAFPTEAHSNWQWWYVIHHSAAMILDPLPAEIEPIVRVIDDWFHVRRLALAFEVEVGAGRLLVTSVDLSAADNPVVPQLRYSFFNYLRQPSKPTAVTVTPEALQSLLTPSTRP